MTVIKKSFLDKLNEIDKKNEVLSMSLVRIPEQELTQLNQKTINEILQTDPSPIIEEFFDMPVYDRGSYKFRRRDEDANASCFFSLKNGAWIYHDFGDSSNEGKGNILTLLQYGKNGKNKLTFKEAVALCVDRLNVKDYGKEKLDEAMAINYYLKQQNEVSQRKDTIKKFEESISTTLKDAEEKALELKTKNEVMEKNSEKFSRVSYASKLIPDRFMKFLKEERGIDTVPDWMFYIKGENFIRSGKNNEIITKTNNVEGIGVLTANLDNLDELQKVLSKIEEKGFIHINESLDDIKLGGDVHIIPYIDKYGNKQKTRSFGVGGITVINSKIPSNKYFIGESKMDGAVADNSFEFNKNGFNLILANSTNNVDKVSNYLNQQKEKETPLQVYHLNQNDVAGVEFTSKLIMNCELNKFGFLEFKKEEYKQDANDLTLNGNFLSDRIKIGTLDKYKEQVAQLKNHLEETKQLTPNTEKKLLDILKDTQIDNKKEDKALEKNRTSYRVINEETELKKSSVRRLR